MFQSVISRQRGRAPKWALLAAGTVTMVAASVGLTAGTAGATAVVVPSGTASSLTAVQSTPTSSLAVTVQWSSTGVTWDDGSDVTAIKKWDVSVTGGTIGAGDCSPGPIDDSVNTCSFTPSVVGTYTVSVTPRNDFGTGTPATVTVDVKSAPTGTPTVTATQAPSSAVVNVNWSLPNANWGNGATKTWDVSVTGGTMSPDNCTAIGVPDGANSCAFTASTDGATYTVSVTPVNEVGNGSPATAPVTVTLPPAPTAPSGTPTVSATQAPSSGVVNVNWSLPAPNWGNGANKRWNVSVSGGSMSSNGCALIGVADGSNSCAFTASTDGATYTVSVTPVTDNGSGSPGTAPVTVNLPASPPPPAQPAPNAPTGVTGTPGDNSITVSWTAPVGGGPVDGYVAWATATDLGQDFKAFCPEEPLVTATTCTITQLPAGLAYTLHVVAIGPEDFSDEATGTPSGPPTGLPETPAEVPAGLTPVAEVSTTPGAQVTISGDGYKAGSTVVISVHSTPVNLGTATVGPDGTFTATVTLPASLAAGNHTLLATGLATNGTVKYMSKALVVSAASGTGGGSGALPTTGVNTTRLVLGAVALLVLGVAVVAVTDGRIVRRLRRRTGTTG